VQDKLERYQELFDANQRLMQLGAKFDDLSEKYFNNKSKKTLFSELLKVVEIENSKRKKIAVKEKKKLEIQQQELIKEVEKKVEVIREKKKEDKEQKKQQQEANKTHFQLKVGDRVRMIDGKSVGTIDAIEKKKATVNYGFFTSKVNLDQLEMVERKK